MTALTPGRRLRSATCTTEVLVVAPGAGVLTCGGKPMAPASGASEAAASTPAGGQACGTLLGKRYRSPDGRLQLLCLRQGDGRLALDGVPLEVMTPKTLPASD
ncbi:hypothetical protein LJR225_001070 [Phenylobacterium sp. LjRoot225]|uniref:hypothetical protein n=1 Tax=Phenylobacterium sp. LjRoot225 TaxID=3342285 RepID=UPI003ECC6D8C